MSIKNTASGERLFRLRGCSEDDTIFIGNKWHSSECYFETYWRMFQLNRSYWRRDGFYFTGFNCFLN